MKRLLIPLLALAMVLACLPALGEDAVTLEIGNLARLPIYAADDPWLEGLIAEEEAAPAEGEPAEAAEEDEALPVLVLSVKKGVQFQVIVRPQNTKNKKVTLAVEDGDVAKVQGNNVTGLKEGETLLTLTSDANPSVSLRYRLVVIQPLSRLSLSAPAKSVAVGETLALVPAYLPENATRKQVVWTSADERVATVDENGQVTGVARGTARIVATANDGSGLRANISLPVTQSAEEIVLDRADVTVDVGRNTVLKATVLPKDTNDKSVVWSSSNESIATVNNQGRVTGAALGECEIICTSKTTGEVQARATVHVQQPVTKLTFGEAPAIFVGEAAQLTWTTEPADASNPGVALTSANPKIATVSADGSVTGVSAGEVWINAVTTDGSNRTARVKVRVGQHVDGVQMKRKVGYIDIGATQVAGAIISPKNASNQNMTWESADPAVAKVEPVKKQPWRVSITGVAAGQTVITGTTEDGGFQTSLTVNVGNYDAALTLDKKNTYVTGADIVLRVVNDSKLTITSITAEVTVRDINGKGVPCNSRDGSATFKVVYKGTLAPGEHTTESKWHYVNYMLPDSPIVSEFEVRITEFQIDYDWVKVIRKRNQPSKKCPVHI